MSAKPFPGEVCEHFFWYNQTRSTATFLQWYAFVDDNFFRNRFSKSIHFSFRVLTRCKSDSFSYLRNNVCCISIRLFICLPFSTCSPWLSNHPCSSSSGSQLDNIVCHHFLRFSAITFQYWLRWPSADFFAAPTCFRTPDLVRHNH